MKITYKTIFIAILSLLLLFAPVLPAFAEVAGPTSVHIDRWVNGKVAHNIGYVKVDSLEYWVTRYDGRCWGWNGGVNLTGKSEYNCKPAGTFMKGKD